MRRVGRSASTSPLRGSITTTAPRARQRVLGHLLAPADPWSTWAPRAAAPRSRTRICRPSASTSTLLAAVLAPEERSSRRSRPLCPTRSPRRAALLPRAPRPSPRARSPAGGRRTRRSDTPAAARPPRSRPADPASTPPPWRRRPWSGRGHPNRQDESGDTLATASTRSAGICRTIGPAASSPAARSRRRGASATA